jgi:hypothetical protein
MRDGALYGAVFVVQMGLFTQQWTGIHAVNMFFTFIKKDLMRLAFFHHLATWDIASRICGGLPFFQSTRVDSERPGVLFVCIYSYVH